MTMGTTIRGKAIALAALAGSVVAALSPRPVQVSTAALRVRERRPIPGKVVMRFLRNLGRTRRAAVIVVTHDERMIEVFDWAYHMIDGRITNH